MEGRNRELQGHGTAKETRGGKWRAARQLFANRQQVANKLSRAGCKKQGRKKSEEGRTSVADSGKKIGIKKRWKVSELQDRDKSKT
jgi:hypothetical protein